MIKDIDIGHLGCRNNFVDLYSQRRNAVLPKGFEYCSRLALKKDFIVPDESNGYQILAKGPFKNYVYKKRG